MTNRFGLGGLVRLEGRIRNLSRFGASHGYFRLPAAASAMPLTISEQTEPHTILRAVLRELEPAPFEDLLN